MTDTAALLAAIRHLPSGAKLTVTVEKDDLVRALTSPGAGEPFDGVGTTDAARILGTPERKTRRLHARWERMQARGDRPPVRVSRKNPGNPNSDLLFDRDDCLAYAAHGVAAGPELVDADADPNDPHAIARSLLRGRP